MQRPKRQGRSHSNAYASRCCSGALLVADAVGTILGDPDIVSSFVRRRPLTDRPKRRRRLVVTALAAAEGRKTLQIEFSAHRSKLERDRS